MNDVNELVRVENQQIVTDSRSVATHFEKQHKDVLESIREILAAENSAAKWFHETTYENRGKQYPMFLMNRKGFSLLAMGFTGKKALEWKVKYINAFEAMEEALKTPRITPNPHYRTRMIGTAVRDVGKTAEALEKVFGCRHGMALATASSMVGEAYGIDMTPVQCLIPAEDNPGTLSPSQIAESLGLINRQGNPDAQTVNRMLQSCGLQDKPRDAKGANLKNAKWFLTEEGKSYGEQKAMNNKKTGYSGYQICWSADVIDARYVGMRSMMIKDEEHDD